MLRRSLVFLFAALIATGCDALNGISNIEYRVTGTAERVSVTYETESGVAQAQNLTLPWSYARKGKEGDFLYIAAQITEGNGSVTVSIYKGSTLLESTTSTGFASIATASTSLR